MDDESSTYITLTRGKYGMGFNIRGGTDNQIYPGVNGIYVMALRPKGTAHHQGKLKLYDNITEINGVNIENVSHRYALDIFKRNEVCRVKVIRNVFSDRLKRSRGQDLGIDYADAGDALCDLAVDQSDCRVGCENGQGVADGGARGNGSKNLVADVTKKKASRTLPADETDHADEMDYNGGIDENLHDANGDRLTPEEPPRSQASTNGDEAMIRDVIGCVRIAYSLAFVSVLAIIGFKITNEICRH